MGALLDKSGVEAERLLASFAFDPSVLTEPGMIARLALQVALLLASAFFSGSETALFSLSRLDLEKLRRERTHVSEVLHALLDEPRRLIISILCGNELVNIAASVNMAGILISLYGDERAGLVTVLVMVPLLLLLGEVTPKTIAVSNPVRISRRLVAGPMSAWVRLVTPLVWLIRGVSDRVTTFFVGPEKAPDNILRVDEFRSLVETGAEEGQINATERALIHNLLESGDTEIVEIMTPRTRTKFIEASTELAAAVAQFREFRHPRVPAFRGSRDNLVGFLHAEDILRLVLDEADLDRLSLTDVLRPPVVVPLTKKVDEMFDFFQSNQARAAAVLNEFGGVEGFVTMKDVLTFIFGEISGDVRGRELYRERDGNVYDLPGDMKLTDFNNLTHFGLDDPRMTTIAGVAFRHLDRLPRVGDKVTVDDIVITVQEVDAHRIARVRVARGGSGLPDDTADTSPGNAAMPARAAPDGGTPDGGVPEGAVAAEPGPPAGTAGLVSSSPGEAASAPGAASEPPRDRAGSSGAPREAGGAG